MPNRCVLIEKGIETLNIALEKNLRHGSCFNKAGYTATEVACGWAGAVINKSSKDHTWSAVPDALLGVVS